DPAGHRGLGRRGIGGWLGARAAARDVEAAARHVGIDVVVTTLAADARGLEHAVRFGGGWLLRIERCSAHGEDEGWADGANTHVEVSEESGYATEADQVADGPRQSQSEVMLSSELVV